MFKDRLKKIMEEKGLNSAAVSSMTGIGASSISQYLSGKVNPPDKKKEQIALALGVDADFFKRGIILFVSNELNDREYCIYDKHSTKNAAYYVFRQIGCNSYKICNHRMDQIHYDNAS